ncbi:hypothetical protein V2W45_1248314 [Cenococcum geophilum]
MDTALPSESPLCTLCSNIDFAQYFCREVGVHRGNDLWPCAGPNAVRMGFLEELMERSSRCAFCRLVVNAICKRRALHLWKSPQKLLEIDPREGPSTSESLINDTYRIGIATRTVSDSTIRSDSFRDHVGTIQLSGDSAPKIGKNKVIHGRKMGQRQVDFRLVKRWLYICENTHGSLCGTTESYEQDGIGGMTAPKDLFVIDVRRMCICKSPPRARYLALSYCWPTKYDPFTTTQSNVSEMLTPRSLDKYGDFLPAAINDAIQLQHWLLGESYLWVDSDVIGLVGYKFCPHNQPIAHLKAPTGCPTG